MNRCLFCGEDALTPEHLKFCDGRQGRIEAELELRSAPHFNGPAYEPKHDHARLTGQILRVWDLMRDGQWRTLQEIADRTGDPPASISAQLRHLRKKRFGLHTVERRSRGDRVAGLWEYRVLEHVMA
jgi:DNA-binding CsgD family transcriptional regulator